MAEAAIFFVITLCVCYVVVSKSSVVQTAIGRFSDFLQTKAFPSTSDFEYKKFAFLRIIFGYLLLNRAVNIFILLLPSEYFAPAGLWCIADIVAALFIMTGFLTQWALIFLMFFMWHIGEGVMLTSTLGNDIAASLSLLLLLTSAGKYLSVDGKLISQFKNLTKVLLYNSDIPNRRSIALAKFVVLFCYFGTCVYSLAVHLDESAWMTGVAGAILFCHNFTTAPYHHFTELFANNSAAVFLARNSLWIMMFWYPTIMPFTLMGGLFRAYTIYWGLLFLCFSSFVLQLGSLAEFEFVMWAGIFWAKTGIDQTKKLSVFYDDKCNLCDRTMWLISRLDIFNRITLCPLSLNEAKLNAHGVKTEDALENLYGIEDGSSQIKFGYDFYIQLAQSLFLLWPILPFLYLGKLLRIGPWIYAAVAKKRRELFGVCVLPSKKLFREQPVVTNSLGHVGNAIFVQVCVLAVFYYIAIPAPYLGYHGFPNAGAKAASYYGMTAINVFNRGDLRTAENWFTLQDMKADKLVPLFTKDGGRLKLHRSDRVYFGHTLRYRRGFIGAERCLFSEWNEPLDYLSKVYLHSSGAAAGQYTFEYVQYHQALPEDVKILQNEYKIAPPSIRCTKQFEVNYEP